MQQDADLATVVSTAAQDIGGFIRAQREAAHVSVRQLAVKAGVSNPYLSQIERGMRKPSADVLSQIAKALRCPAEVLYVRAGILEPGQVGCRTGRHHRRRHDQRAAEAGAAGHLHRLSVRRAKPAERTKLHVRRQRLPNDHPSTKIFRQT